jgi:RNA polymerase sigma-70 factor, ECF subfamily
MDPRFDRIYADHCAYVCRSLRRLGVAERDLEDVAQEAFLAIHKHLGSYDPSRPIKPWLFGFAYHTAANYRRGVRRKPQNVEAAPSERHETTPEDELVASERRQLLRRALAEVDVEHRAVLILVDLDDVEPKAVAEALDLPIATVYSRVRNGRIKLKEAIELIRAEVPA